MIATIAHVTVAWWVAGRHSSSRTRRQKRINQEKARSTTQRGGKDRQAALVGGLDRLRADDPRRGIAAALVLGGSHLLARGVVQPVAHAVGAPVAKVAGQRSPGPASTRMGEHPVDEVARVVAGQAAWSGSRGTSGQLLLDDPPLPVGQVGGVAPDG